MTWRYVGVLAREVEQRTDDLLDLEPGLLDEAQPFVRLCPGRGLLEQELGQSEDREEWVVDLVRDACSELADRRELAALDEARIELRRTGRDGEDAEEERIVVPVERVPADVGGRPRVRRSRAGHELRLEPCEVDKRPVCMDDPPVSGHAQDRGDRHRLQGVLELPPARGGAFERVQGFSRPQSPPNPRRK